MEHFTLRQYGNLDLDIDNLDTYESKMSPKWTSPLGNREELNGASPQYPGSYIFPSSENTPVYWGHSSILQAELFCLSDLLNNNRSWKYAINLAGSEMMTWTNKELVAWLSLKPTQIHVSSFPFPQGGPVDSILKLNGLLSL